MNGSVRLSHEQVLKGAWVMAQKALNPVCTANVNGTELICGCSGCGAVYAHDDKKYYFLCCGVISVIDANSHPDNPKFPRIPGQIVVDIENLQFLDAIRLFDRILPGKLIVNSTITSLKKKKTLKMSGKIKEVISGLGLTLKS
jgi:hypothetical protein